jgi:serine/threonine protein kinase
MYSESSQSHDHQWAIMGPSDWWRRQRRDSASSSTFVRTILWQLLTALDQIHSNGIVHRDIKPENVMVQREGLQSEDDAQLHIRVIDFGSSLDDYTLSNSLFSKSGISSAQTTVEYSPPEQLFGSRYWEKMATESHIHPYARASDIWAAGVIALELVLGTPNVFELTDVERKTFEKKMKAAGRDGRDLASHRLLLLLRGMLELCVHPSMRLDVDRKAMPKGNHVASVRCNDAYFGQKVKEKDPMHWGFTDDAIDLVRRMLHWDSGKRISAREALAHAFFNSNS